MTNRNDLLEAIANIISDYRSGEIPTPTPDHVDRWVSQFSPAVQLPLLLEMQHVLERTYINKHTVEDFLVNLVKNPKLAGNNFCAFWQNIEFLDIQQGGRSQHEMLTMFSNILQQECGFPIQQGLQNPQAYIYLDDGLFSGSRIQRDIEQWIRNDAPTTANLHIILAVQHTSGIYFTEKKLNKIIAETNKKITLIFWTCISIENRKYNKNTSEILWPHELPEDKLLEKYVDTIQHFPFEPRSVLNNKSYQHRVFSSESGRQLLEREFLLAGVKIRSFCQNPKPIMRPLGYSSFGLGFGSTVVTFRNCPNNAPLALWWGDATLPSNHPLSKWYPLFPRKTYSQNTIMDYIDDFDLSEFGL